MPLDTLAARQWSFRFQAAAELALKPGGGDFYATAPSSWPFWQALGFVYAAVDLEGDAIRIDLDRASLPRRLTGPSISW